jgi:hypothetical protein
MKFLMLLLKTFAQMLAPLRHPDVTFEVMPATAHTPPDDASSGPPESP